MIELRRLKHVGIFYPTILRMVIYKRKDYLFQLVSVAVSTCRKEVQNKRKQFPLVKKFLSTGTKSFPNKFDSTIFSKGFPLQKKMIK